MKPSLATGSPASRASGGLCSRGRRIAVFTAMFALLLAWPGSAFGSPSGASVRGLSTTSNFVETTYDLQGRVVNVRSGPGSSQPYRGAAMGSAASETSTLAAAATLSSGGCKQVDWYESLHSWIGSLLGRFHQVKSWCWSYPAVTSINVGTYVSDVACCIQYAGLVAYYGWYYTWSGSSRGGHYSFREGKFTNCLFKYGCTGGEAYPWVEIYVNGNGAWIGYDGH